MSLRTNKRVVLAKIEGTYGTDPTPTGGANAMQVQNLTATPVDATQVQRNLIRPFFGNSPILLAEINSKLEFEVEAAGCGIFGLPPAYGPLLRACALAETLSTEAITGITRSGGVATAQLAAHGLKVGSKFKIEGCDQTEYNGVNTVTVVGDSGHFSFAVSGTPVSPATGTPVLSNAATYAPISEDFESVTLYFYEDTVLHKITGAFGTVELTLDTKKVPIFKFSFLGIYNDPSDVSSPTADFSQFAIPKVANTLNTPAFALFGYDGILSSLSLNVANDLQYRSLIGLQEVLITDRKPTGTIVIEAPTIASKDFFTAIKNGATGSMSLTHGIDPGNVVSIAAPLVSLGNPSYADDSGVQMLSIPYTASPTDGNDDFSFTFT